MTALQQRFEQDAEIYEAGAFRAEIRFKRSYCDNLHWDMKHWGHADGHDANGITHSFPSIDAARDAAERWVSKGLSA